MSLVFSIFASDILPIFAIAGAGFLLARYAGTDVKTLAHVVFYAVLPCLVFRLLVTSPKTELALGRIVILALLIMFAMGLIGYVSARVAGLDRVGLRAFLLVVMFSNAGNYGLSVVRFAFGPEALTYATVFFLTGSVMTYVIGAFFADSTERRFSVLSKVARMPALYGAVLALAVLGSGRQVPESVMRPITLLGDAALPLMVLVLGMQLDRATLPSRPKIVALAVGLSLLAAPLVALGLTSFLGISGAARQAAVTLSSMPVAVTTILALEFGLAPEFVTNTVFVSTMVSPLTLTLLIAYLR